MGELIRLVKCSGIEDTAPFLIPVASIRAVRDPGPEGEPTLDGVFLVEIAGRPGPHWTWNLDLADIPKGLPQ